MSIVSIFVFAISLFELTLGIVVVVHPDRPGDKLQCQRTEALLKQGISSSKVQDYYSQVRQVRQLWYMDIEEADLARIKRIEGVSHH